VETWAFLRAEAVRRRVDIAPLVDRIVDEWRACQGRETAA